MKSWIRKLRGALGLGISWALGWGVVGALFGVGITLWVDPGVSTAMVAWSTTKMFAALGVFAGGAFSLLLGATQHRRRFDELSIPRFAILGAAGGALLSLGAIGVWGFGGVAETVTLVTILTSLSSASAAGTLTLARRSDDQELLSAAEGVAGVGLTGDETRDLLGDG